MRSCGLSRWEEGETKFSFNVFVGAHGRRDDLTLDLCLTQRLMGSSICIQIQWPVNLSYYTPIFSWNGIWLTQHVPEACPCKDVSPCKNIRQCETVQVFCRIKERLKILETIDCVGRWLNGKRPLNWSTVDELLSGINSIFLTLISRLMNRVILIKLNYISLFI